MNKFFYLMLICTWEVGSIPRNIIASLDETLISAPNILPNWISKLRRQRHKNQHNTIHGGGKFSQNLCPSKNVWYNERNYKSGRHNQQHTFRHCKSQINHTSTDNPNLGLKVKEKKGREQISFSLQT